MITSRLRSYLLVTLVCLFVVKLMIAGVVFMSSRRTSTATVWKGATALAGEKLEEAKKKSSSDSTKAASSKLTAEAPDLAVLQREISALEAHLREISAGLDRYVLTGGKKTPISPETLEQKRRRLEKQRAELDAEHKRLDALKQEIEEKISRLTAIQTALQSKLEEKKTIRDERLKHLIKIYTPMPAKKEAMLIDKMEMNV
ncbi:MAG: hypothetical protein JRI36_07205, partial [Deltaproteobacteria bacterium]|nr:hypothetical protein [Deltaproteobacteria bacterium]